MNQFTKSVLETIRKTRDISLPHWGNAEVTRQKDHSAHNIVTELDEKVEKFLAKELAKIDSSIEYVGEEFGGNRNAKRFWLVDPIDGTTHFVRGLPFCTTMVALIEDSRVTFSAIYDFVNDIMYHAVRGGGAFQDNEPIHVSNRDIASAYAGYESRIEKEGNLKKYLEARQHFLTIQTINSGYEHVLVATGKIEACICYDPYGYDYDFAPGSLLIEEAGGIVANIGKTTYDYTNTNYIASNKKVFEALTQGDMALFPISQ